MENIRKSNGWLNEQMTDEWEEKTQNYLVSYWMQVSKNDDIHDWVFDKGIIYGCSSRKHSQDFFVLCVLGEGSKKSSKQEAKAKQHQR